jgi:hypothetical protein
MTEGDDPSNTGITAAESRSLMTVEPGSQRSVEMAIDSQPLCNASGWWFP